MIEVVQGMEGSAPLLYSGPRWYQIAKGAPRLALVVDGLELRVVMFAWGWLLVDRLPNLATTPLATLERVIRILDQAHRKRFGRHYRARAAHERAAARDHARWQRRRKRAHLRRLRARTRAGAVSHVAIYDQPTGGRMLHSQVITFSMSTKPYQVEVSKVELYTSDPGVIR